MYLPEIENLYILYGTQLLLDGTKQSFDYDKPIFDDPLPNAKFDENYQQINTSWQRNMSMTPLFVASQERAAVMNMDRKKKKACSFANFGILPRLTRKSWRIKSVPRRQRCSVSPKAQQVQYSILPKAVSIQTHSFD